MTWNKKSDEIISKLPRKVRWALNQVKKEVSTLELVSHYVDTEHYRWMDVNILEFSVSGVEFEYLTSFKTLSQTYDYLNNYGFVAARICYFLGYKNVSCDLDGSPSKINNILFK
jgi:hypothetical protein